MITTLLLFGATGDLAGRYLLPALANLLAAGKLPEGFGVVGAAIEDWEDDTFREHALQRLERHAPEVPIEFREALARALRYQHVDLNDQESVSRLVHIATDSGRHPVASYLALPPGLYPRVVNALGVAGLPSGSRIVVEKPYGEDLPSTIALNDLLDRVTEQIGEQAIFRVDFVLGSTPAQNLLGIRFANPILEAVWNSTYIDQIDVLWEENLALEGRASFYDRAGALKDVVQNHLLQILCLVAMEPPASLSSGDLQKSRLDILRSVRLLTPDEAASKSQRARYTAGRMGDREIPAYVEEDGVDPNRGTETFAEMLLDVETPRWMGTRFVMRTGKGLSHMRREVVVHFRTGRGLPFGSSDTRPSRGGLRLDVDGQGGIELQLFGSTAGPSPYLVPLTLAGRPPASDLPAYSRVLLDILSGGSSLSVGRDESEQEWRIVTPVLQAWAEGRVPMEEYPAGSDGPPRLIAAG